MRIGLIGVGRMGSVLARLLASGNVDLCLFDRNTENMNMIAKELNISTANNLEELVKIGTVILAVPDNEVVRCIKMFNQIKEPITVINIATNVS